MTKNIVSNENSTVPHSVPAYNEGMEILATNPINYIAAFSNFKIAADSGMEDAKLMVAACYLTGFGAIRDMKTAVQLYENHQNAYDLAIRFDKLNKFLSSSAPNKNSIYFFIIGIYANVLDDLSMYFPFNMRLEFMSPEQVYHASISAIGPLKAVIKRVQRISTFFNEKVFFFINKINVYEYEKYSDFHDKLLNYLREIGNGLLQFFETQVLIYDKRLELKKLNNNLSSEKSRLQEISSRATKAREAHNPMASALSRHGSYTDPRPEQINNDITGKIADARKSIENIQQQILEINEQISIALPKVEVPPQEQDALDKLRNHLTHFQYFYVKANTNNFNPDFKELSLYFLHIDSSYQVMDLEKFRLLRFFVELVPLCYLQMNHCFLSGNNINDMIDLISNLDNLIDLDVSYNSLTDIEINKLFEFIDKQMSQGKLYRLKYINISNNLIQIHKLSFGKFITARIEDKALIVDLSHNFVASNNAFVDLPKKIRYTNQNIHTSKIDKSKELTPEKWLVFLACKTDFHAILLLEMLDNLGQYSYQKFEFTYDNENKKISIINEFVIIGKFHSLLNSYKQRRCWNITESQGSQLINNVRESQEMYEGKSSNFNPKYAGLAYTLRHFFLSKTNLAEVNCWLWAINHLEQIGVEVPNSVKAGMAVSNLVNGNTPHDDDEPGSITSFFSFVCG